MSKNYNQISSQVACVQTKNRTLAFYVKIENAPLERYNEIIDGKIKLLLKDFTAGKGDRSLNPYYNLDLKDVYYLYHRARQFWMPEPFQGTKIMNNVETEGPYKGMSLAFHLSISRTDQKKGKSGEMETAKQPWNITVENGYAIASPGAIPGSYYEKSGTFKATETAYINLTDQDFLMCMESIYKCIEIYRELYGRTMIPKGLKELGEKYRRNSYSGEEETTQQEETEKEKEDRTQESQPSQPSDSSDSMAKTHPTPLLIDSDFVAMEGGRAAAICLIKGKKYNIIFDQVTDDIVEAKINKNLVTGALYADQNKICHCSGLIQE